MSQQKTVRTVVAALLGLVLVVGSVSLGAPLRAAAVESSVPPVVDNPQNAVTADALPTAQINGVVWDQAVVGTTVYAAGQFTSARPAGSAPGTNERPRANLMSYNLVTGVMTSWAPQVNGRIRVITASPDGSRIYIGGSFTQVNGQARSRIAAFNTSDGSLVGSFAPRVASDVFGITATDTTVYLGGWFQSVNNVARTRLAAVAAGNGALLNWAPTADHTVYGLGLTETRDRVVVTGSFSQLNGAPATSIGSLDATSGTSFPFAANTVVHNTGNTASLMSLKVVGDKAYTSGFWYGGTGNFEGGLVVDPYDGRILMMVNCLGDTYDITPMNGLAYMVSHHHQCTDSGGFAEEVPRIWQHTDAFTIEPSGLVQPNTYGYPNFAGHPSGSSVHWFPTMTPGAASGSEQAGWSIEAAGDYLLVGGEFPRVNGTPQQGLVRFATRNVVSSPAMGPAGHSNDTVPRLDALSATSVRVRFMADFDRDGTTLTYRVVRNDLGEGAPVHTVTTASTFWNRPWLQFVDSGLVAGRTYAYRVIATDADGNSRVGEPAVVTAGENVPDASAYAAAVAADGAQHHWRLREAPGAPYAVDHGTAGVDLTLGAGVTLGRPGAIIGSPDTAAGFSGTDTGRAVSSSSEAAPDTFSAELWFRTTSTSGGKLLGFGNAAAGSSSSYDRHVYLNDAGQITFGVYPGEVRAITSSNSYNDGAWHHVVATLGSGGMTLHVDGLRIGSTLTTAGQPYEGYWRVGGDSLGGWPNAGSSVNFAGDIDDVAIYPTALSQTQIRDHYTRSGREVQLPPRPTDGYGLAVMNSEPSLYWRLDDAGATAADTSGNGQTGVYVGATQGVPSAVVPGNAAAGFDGVGATIGSSSPWNNPTVFSVEAWFNTTSTAGGKIIGFGRSQSGWSGSYDRHIYLSPSGRLNFGTYTGVSNIITTPDAYNDGAWHHVVGTLGPEGMALYVDGVPQGTHPATGAENYTGYWRVGGDSSWDGSGFLAGTIDEVAVYERPLDLASVRTHYRASSAAVNRPPSASVLSSCTASSCDFTAEATDADGTIASWAWDFGDGTSATGASVTHVYDRPGTYAVSLVVTDDAGATATATDSVTLRGALPAPTDAYGAAVYADDPLIQWRLDETAGPTAYDTSRNTNDGTYVGVATGQPSPVTQAGLAAGFGGDGDAVVADELTTNPTVFSVEAWFSTTSTGGRIIGFGTAASGRSSLYDRHIYLDEQGRAVFGVWAGDSSHTVTTAQPVNDGAWHQVVGTFGPGGMALYLDGALVGTNANTAVDPYDGHWRLGADHVWSGSGEFVGLIDEAAVYGRVLSATTVRDHHRAAASFVNAAPTAAFEASRAGLTVEFDGAASGDPDGTVVGWSWDFGDGTAATEGSASHTYAAPGTYTVRLTVTDDLGATATTEQQVTVREPLPTPTDPYARAVTADAPAFYWRLDEPGGSAVLDATANTRDGRYVGDVERGVGSYVASGNPAAGFSAGDFAVAADRSTNPTTFSLEAWFRTNGTGGRIIGFGDATTGRSASYDRHVYVAQDGRLVFGTWIGSEATVTSPSAYNDGAWHHVVATLDDSGRALYVDGVQVASSDVPGAQTYDGYWRVGADHVWSGSGDFDGAIDEVAVYGHVLSADRIAAHHEASTVVNTAPTAAFATTLTDLTVTFDSTASVDPDGAIASHAWDFGDGTTGTEASPTHTYAAPGTYTVTLTVTDDRGATGTVTQDVVVARNQPPTASFTAAVTDLTVAFDAAASGDPDGTIADWTWDFGDGQRGMGRTATYTYAAPGTYTVTLTVLDDRGATATTTRQVTVVAANTPPTATFTAATDALAVALDASGSVDDRGIVSYGWEFGDGATASGVTASHTYATPGTYTVTLTVTDTDGVSATASQAVTVTAPEEPEQGIVAADAFGRTSAAGSWGSADVGGPWTLTGASSFSTDGSAGVVTVPVAGATRSAALNAVSALDASITGSFAFDTAPRGSYIQQVWARAGGAADRYSMQLRWETNGTVRLLLARTVNGSETILRAVPLTGFTVGAGEVVRYRFDVVGATPTTLSASVWKAGAAEPASPQVTVTDTAASLQDAGAVALRFYTGGSMTSLPFVVRLDDFVVRAPGTTPPPPNRAPVAAFAAATAGLGVSVDGGASSDPDGSVAAYAWDFGDGATASGVTANHTYAAAGTYLVALQVTDDDGATHRTSQSVTVTAPPAGALALDEFDRAASNGWGSAAAGGAWSHNAASSFGAAQGVGTISVPVAGATRSAALGSVSARDVAIVTDLTLDRAPAGGTYLHQLRARVEGDGYYTMTTRFLANGTLNVMLTRTVGGTETTLRSVNLAGFNLVAGEKVNLRFDVVGNGTTSLEGRVWRGTTAPAEATVGVTDATPALQRPGAVGLRAYTGGGMTSVPLTVGVDRFAVEAR